MKLLKHFVKTPMRLLLRSRTVRDRVAFELRQHYYADLQVRVPLGFGLACPVCFEEAWVSFSQIFFESEYDRAFRRIPLPRRWLDLGCHAGYFSLYVAWLRARQGFADDFQALLVDGDARVKPAVDRLTGQARLHGRLHFQHGLISAQPGEHLFAEQHYMDSGIAEIAAIRGPTRPVRTIDATELMRLLPPPYDLVKLDVEGGEYDFFAAYQPVLQQTAHLIVEWHSWHPGGGGREQIEGLAAAQGFVLDTELLAAQPVPRGSGTGYCGVCLFLRKELAASSPHARIAVATA